MTSRPTRTGVLDTTIDLTVELDVIAHHLPALKSIAPRHANDPLNPAFENIIAKPGVSKLQGGQTKRMAL